MKKILSFLLVMAALCNALVGCGFIYESPVKETKAENNTTLSGQKKELIFGLNETAIFSNLKFTASELNESNGKAYFAPEDGNVFVGIKFTIENISDEEQAISSLLMFEGYVDDVKCDYSLNAAVAFEDTLDGSLAAGKKLVGWYGLEVPRDWSVIELNILNNWLSDKPAKFVFLK